jgi:glycosyltransferase involved in cell wall biosynthesis
LKKLAIITTHPIQYNAPIFKLLAERKNIQVKVFYTWENSKEGVFDKKFNQTIKWDIPLLDGYEYEFVKNTSKDQGSHRFRGIINPGLNKQIENWGANAILVYGWRFHSHFNAIRYFKGKIPVYFRGDSIILNQKPGLKTILRHIWLTYVYHFIDYALYVGTNNKNYFLKHGLSESQLIFVPHAIDNERFADKDGGFEKTAKKWRIDLGFMEDDLVFLFAGKFEKKKNPMFFINAARKLLKEPKVKFLLVGNGELENNMKKNSTENVIFLSFQNQSVMPVVYRLGDVFTLPSDGPDETWGLSVNEAMACGKAVLTSDMVGCTPDLVKIGENGFVFKANDFDDFIEKIQSYNKDNIITFGKQSLNYIEKFSQKNIVIAIESTINQNLS